MPSGEVVMPSGFTPAAMVVEAVIVSAPVEVLRLYMDTLVLP